MKKTSKFLAALAVVAVTFGLGACTKDSTDNTDKPAASENKAAASKDEDGAAKDTSEKDSEDKDTSGTEEDSYCAALDEFTDASLNGIKDIDFTDPESAAEYAKAVRDAANSAAEQAPTSELADMWKEYAKAVGSADSTPASEFTTKLQESVLKYCANYDFDYMNK